MNLIDKNFLANASFVMKNEGTGSTVTFQVTPVKDNNNHYVSWSDLVNEVSSGDRILSGVSSVSPTFGDGNDAINWGEFWSRNPFHISKLNLRASKSAVLPTQIIVLTPNVFTGQYDRQILDVSANKSAYQYQNDIITIECDLFISRSSKIHFNGAFDETTAPALYIDAAIDKYISLEKGLVENVTLLKTDAGLNDLISGVVNVEVAKAEQNPFAAQAAEQGLITYNPNKVDISKVPYKGAGR